MRMCPSCKVKIQADTRICPLCHAALGEEDGVPCVQAYPAPQRIVRRRQIAVRLLLMLTLLCGCCCVMINELSAVSYRWWPYPVSAFLYLWLAVPTFFKKGQNPAGQIFWQAVLLQGFLLLLDAYTGGMGWSVYAVLPALGCAVNTGIALLMLIRRHWARYAIYQVCGAVFGLLPVLLRLLGVCYTLVMPVVSAAFSLCSLLAVLLFGGETVRQEFRRRFHF